MLRLKLRVLPAITGMSVFVVFITVLPLAGQTDPSLPSPAVLAPLNRIFLPFIANVELNASGEYPPLRNDGVNAAAHSGNSAEEPPIANRHTFATDSGGHLDRSWFRTL